ncbi:MAG: hypothetical protein ABWY05_05865 [Noviherbaspirillum sp.]
MERQNIDSSNQYALRIEGRGWLDDLTIEQVWATLQAEYQQLQHHQDLLFLTLLPSGEMPAKCLLRSIFEYSMASPAMLAPTLAPAVNGNTLLISGEPELASDN